MNSSPKDERRPNLVRRSDALFLLAIIGIMAVVSAAAFPFLSNAAAQMIPPCFLLTVTGLRCPLCGGTRCVGALVRLDFAKALYYNPMVVVSALICAYLYVRVAIACCAREYKPYQPKLGYKAWYIVLAAYIIFFIVRNTPAYQTCFY